MKQDLAKRQTSEQPQAAQPASHHKPRVTKKQAIARHAPKLFQPIPRPKKPTLPTVTYFPAIMRPVLTERGIQQKEISKPVRVTDLTRMGDFIQAQAQYAKDYQDWRVNELARQEVLDKFERSCGNKARLAWCALLG